MAGTLGNSEAVRQAQAKERRPAKPESPARETAAKRAQTPERKPEEAPVEVDEFAERLRRSIPGIPSDAIEELRKLYG